MISAAERESARGLMAVLAEMKISEVVHDYSAAKELLGGLEYFLPGVLAQLHPYWAGRSLDGFPNFRLSRIGERSAELIGVCYVLGDKEDPSVVPVQVRLEHSGSNESIDWLECKIGVACRDQTRMKGFPPSGTQGKWAYEISFEPSSIDWAFTVTYGEMPVA